MAADRQPRLVAPENLEVFADRRDEPVGYEAGRSQLEDQRAQLDLRLAGELMEWSPRYFSRVAGGGLAVVGITWLVPIFGFYFGYRLGRAGVGPSSLARAAGLPMVPVGRGLAAGARQIVVYSLVVVAVSLVLPFTTAMTPLYAVAAALLGAMFVYGAERLRRDPTPERAIKLFTFSNTYLALLFTAVAVDTLIG